MSLHHRYIPSLRGVFTFPQSLGILGGKPGASTYIVGVQDDKALYLDPHEVQWVKSRIFHVTFQLSNVLLQFLLFWLENSEIYRRYLNRTQIIKYQILF